MTTFSRESKFRPDSHWRIAAGTEPAATPLDRLGSFFSLSGAGPQADLLEAQFRALVRGPALDLDELGWVAPPAGPIPVLLAGMEDLEWHLEDDEMRR